MGTSPGVSHARRFSCSLGHGCAPVGLFPCSTSLPKKGVPMASFGGVAQHMVHVAQGMVQAPWSTRTPRATCPYPKLGATSKGLLPCGGDEGSWEQARCLESTARAPEHHFTSGNSGFFQRQLLPPPSRAALAVSSLLAPGAVRWHRTSPRSAPQPREQWVTGKWFYFTTISGGTVIQE